MNAKEVAKIVTTNCYTLNEVMLRRIDWYSYKENTTVSVEESRIVIRTEMPIKGVYDTMILYPNGESEIKMEFDHPTEQSN